MPEVALLEVALQRRGADKKWNVQITLCMERRLQSVASYAALVLGAKHFHKLPFSDSILV